MKKMILSAILVMGSAAIVNAQSPEPTVEQTPVPQTEQVAEQDQYKEVALSDLSPAIQEAVALLAGETHNIVKVEFCAEKELTKVTLEDKESKECKSVVLDKEGKEVAPEATKE